MALSHFVCIFFFMLLFFLHLHLRQKTLLFFFQPSLVVKGEQDVKRSKPVAGAWGKKIFVHLHSNEYNFKSD